MKINETIKNFKTGEELTLLSSDGGSTKYEFYLPERRKGPPAHYHTDFSETFFITNGQLDFYIGPYNEHILLTKGQSLTASAGQIHYFSNHHDNAVIFTVEAIPTGGLVKAFQLAFGIANANESADDGLPAKKLVRFYFFYLTGGYIPKIPLIIQKTTFIIVIFILTISGMKRKLDKYII
jgi:mannose-6-phosphate isomerase-like protein (cupin superfamily)